ncbi:hypothetical protein D3C87_1819050 [compost metagenome]
MERDRHAEVEQQVGQCRPLLGLVVFFLRVMQLLKLVHDLPDPRRDCDRTPQKRQHRVEQRPTRLPEAGPAVFGVRH